jgi:hypothetical protein
MGRINILPMNTGNSLLGDKMEGTNESPAFSVEVKNAWNYTSAPPYAAW